MAATPASQPLGPGSAYYLGVWAGASDGFGVGWACGAGYPPCLAILDSFGGILILLVRWCSSVVYLDPDTATLDTTTQRDEHSFKTCYVFVRTRTPPWVGGAPRASSSCFSVVR